jgi:hypothetical protein
MSSAESKLTGSLKTNKICIYLHTIDTNISLNYHAANQFWSLIVVKSATHLTFKNPYNKEKEAEEG